MADLELSQVRLKLTDDPEVLTWLRNNKQFKVDKHNPLEPEFISVQFNSAEIRFHKGEVKTLGKTVAESLYRRSWVICGDHLTGEMRAYLEIVEEVNLGDLVKPKPKFSCPVCEKDMITAQNLAYHLSQDHSDEGEGLKAQDDEEE